MPGDVKRKRSLLNRTGIRNKNLPDTAEGNCDFTLNGKRFIRLCYVGTTADVTEAVERLAAWLKRGELQNSTSSSDTSSGSFMAASIHSRMWGISMMASQ